MKKDDIVTLEISDFSSEGLGIGHSDGIALFVKDTIIGDVAEVKIMKMKKTYGFARLQRIITPSSDRVQAPCPIARRCGGCQIQEMTYSSQLAFKEHKVHSNLQRIGGFSDLPMEPISGMDNPLRYRNKAQFPIGRNKNGKLTAGFYAGRTHSVIDCRDCLLGNPVNQTILDRILSHMERFDIHPYGESSGTGLVRHVMTRIGAATGQIMVCLVINGFSIPEEAHLIDALRSIPGMTSISFSANTEKTNVIMGRQFQVLWGLPYIEDTIGKVRFHISPLSFFQVNPVQTEKLYGKVLEYASLTGSETVWDLYCGIGTISLFLAQKAKSVYGVEIVPDAIRDAKENALLNQADNVSFFTGRAEEILPQKYLNEGISADVIVVDPPRKGCELPVLDTMLKIQPEKIIYVSCDSATLARDLKYLCSESDYEITGICPVDMFPQTVHVETVVKLARK